jgi:hypothetical protein
MKAKPLMTYVGIAGTLVVAWFSTGCADADNDYVRDALRVPLVAGAIIEEGRAESSAQDGFGNPTREYRETHPVNSFEDFDRVFSKPSDDP